MLHLLHAKCYLPYCAYVALIAVALVMSSCINCFSVFVRQNKYKNYHRIKLGKSTPGINNNNTLLG